MEKRKARKSLPQDFKRKKVKLGQKAAQPDNFTDTTVKTKKIVISGQSSLDEKDEYLSRRGQTLAVLLSQTHHVSVSTRKAALIGLMQLFFSVPEIEFRDYINGEAPRILQKIMERVSDGNEEVRMEFLKIFELMMDTVSPSIINSHAALIAAHISAGMSRPGKSAGQQGFDAAELFTRVGELDTKPKTSILASCLSKLQLVTSGRDLGVPRYRVFRVVESVLGGKDTHVHHSSMFFAIQDFAGSLQLMLHKDSEETERIAIVSERHAMRCEFKGFDIVKQVGMEVEGETEASKNNDIVNVTPGQFTLHIINALVETVGDMYSTKSDRSGEKPSTKQELVQSQQTDKALHASHDCLALFHGLSCIDHITRTQEGLASLAAVQDSFEALVRQGFPFPAVQKPKLNDNKLVSQSSALYCAIAIRLNRARTDGKSACGRFVEYLCEGIGNKCSAVVLSIHESCLGFLMGEYEHSRTSVNRDTITRILESAIEGLSVPDTAHKDPDFRVRMISLAFNILTDINTILQRQQVLSHAEDFIHKVSALLCINASTVVATSLHCLEALRRMYNWAANKPKTREIIKGDIAKASLFLCNNRRVSPIVDIMNHSVEISRTYSPWLFSLLGEESEEAKHLRRAGLNTV